LAQIGTDSSVFGTDSTEMNEVTAESAKAAWLAKAKEIRATRTGGVPPAVEVPLPTVEDAAKAAWLAKTETVPFGRACFAQEPEVTQEPTAEEIAKAAWLAKNETVKHFGHSAAHTLETQAQSATLFTRQSQIEPELTFAPPAPTRSEQAAKDSWLAKTESLKEFDSELPVQDAPAVADECNAKLNVVKDRLERVRKNLAAPTRESQVPPTSWATEGASVAPEVPLSTVEDAAKAAWLAKTEKVQFGRAGEATRDPAPDVFGPASFAQEPELKQEPTAEQAGAMDPTIAELQMEKAAAVQEATDTRERAVDFLVDMELQLKDTVAEKESAMARIAELEAANAAALAELADYAAGMKRDEARIEADGHDLAVEYLASQRARQESEMRAVVADWKNQFQSAVAHTEKFVAEQQNKIPAPILEAHYDMAARVRDEAEKLLDGDLAALDYKALADKWKDGAGKIAGHYFRDPRSVVRERSPTGDHPYFRD
jgi:hypothetical protein